ncbi:MAG: FAD-binding oxidoreductase, partial [Candidatus Woesearchaeota archaeon]
FHPLTLLTSYVLISIVNTFSFLFSFGVLAVWIGIISLLSMELFLVFTFLIKLKYQNWKLTHRFLGLSFILASIHVMLIQSDTKTDLFLRIYMIIFIIIGLASFIYRTLLWKKLVKQHDYFISEIKKLGDNITELTLSSKNEKSHISFIPGQFAFLSIESKLISNEQHPFTISSSPAEPVLRFLIKNLGDFTSKISQLKKGTKVKLEGPYGRFCFSKAKYKSQIWIAGGIGITPFLSQARSMKYKEHYGNFTKIDFYYSVNEESEVIFQKELETIKIRNNNFKVIPFISSKQGHLTAEIISKQSKIMNRDIFICGPKPMMFSLKKEFIKMGIPNSRIHTEEFEL